MITRLYVENYKSLQNLEVEFGVVCILMGRNGTGKSAVFEVLHALKRIVCQDDRPGEYFNEGTQTRWDERSEQRFELLVRNVEEPLGKDVFTYRLTVAHDPLRGEPRVSSEQLLFCGHPLFEFINGEMRLYRDDSSAGPVFPGDWRRSGLARVLPGKDNQRLTWFKGWLGKLLVARPNPTLISGRAPAEESSLAPDLSNFASWYRHLAQESPHLVYQALAGAATAIPGFKSLSIRVDEGRVGWIRAKLSVPGVRDYGLDFDQLSDGQRVLLALETVLAHHAEARQLLALDEPDNYLALAEVQPLLMRALDNAFDGGGAQLLVISHHPEFLNQLAPDHGLVFYREGGGPTRTKRFSSTESLPAAELIARGVGDV